MLVTNPALLMTSLVILIFFTHPWHNSSSANASFFSIGRGFFLAVVREKTIGVVLLLLTLLDKDSGWSEVPDLLALDVWEVGDGEAGDGEAGAGEAGAGEAGAEAVVGDGECISVSNGCLRLIFLDRREGISISEVLLRPIFLETEAEISVSMAFLRLIFLDNDEGVGVVLRLALLEKLLGVGVLHLLLEVLERLRRKKLSSILRWLSKPPTGVVG